jgi:A/G-specific adenine glycosylase
MRNRLISASNRSRFRRSLLGWYRRHGRDLPWRQTCDPYAVLVSEFMLQQTQVSAVIPYYNNWLRRFPDFRSLARASENDVLRAWQGLGYYARARNLHASARLVEERYRGNFPRHIESIRGLPGIGRYTANAVATFAFNQSVPIVEANSARVFARLFNLREPIEAAATREKLWGYAADLVPRHGAGRFNSALLDLGALVCLPRNPRCSVCPVNKFCRAKDPQALPVKTARPPLRKFVEDHAFIVSRQRILLQQSAARWRNMWILPSVKAGRSNQRSPRQPIYSSVFPFTNHRITLRIFKSRAPRAVSSRQHWHPIRQLDRLPIPSPHRRSIDQLLVRANLGS